MRRANVEQALEVPLEMQARRQEKCRDYESIM